MRALLLLVAAGGCALTQPAVLPEFDVASVKPSPPSGGDLININLGTANHGVVTLTNTTLSECIRWAYSLVSEAQISGPDWIRDRSLRVDIDAKEAVDRIRVLLQRVAKDGDTGVHHEHVQRPAGADPGDDGVAIGAVRQEGGTACFARQQLRRFRRARVGERHPRAVRREALYDGRSNAPTAAEQRPPRAKPGAPPGHRAARRQGAQAGASWLKSFGGRCTWRCMCPGQLPAPAELRTPSAPSSRTHRATV